MARKAKKTEVTLDKENVTAAQSDAVDEVIDSAEEQEQHEYSYSPCGGVLERERTQQGLTVNEVAKQLRLSVKQIEALEQDDFSSLPESTIVKGFLRNYAKLLKIPAQPLTQAYMEMAPAQEDYAFALDPGINRKISEKAPASFSRYYALALLVLLGFGIWFFYQSYIQKPSPVSPMPEIAEALPELALPMAERSEPASMSVEMPSQEANQESDQQLANSDPAETVASADDRAATSQQTQEEQASATEEVDDDNGDANQIVEPAPVEEETLAPGKSRIQFTATQETWLSVVNANGNEVYNKILYPGHRDTVDVWQPMEIVVGNAHGTTLVVDGEKIDLAPYTRINVARVRLNR